MADTQTDTNKLKADMEALRKDLAALGDTVRDLSTEQFHSLSEQAQKAANSLEKEIQARPLTSVLTAAGIGFLLGRLMDR